MNDKDYEQFLYYTVKWTQPYTNWEVSYEAPEDLGDLSEANQVINRIKSL
jgi:hypothetical protein